MKSLYNQENIDAYLTNKLGAEEARIFVEGLSKDPLIQNEILLQKDIIEALKESRRLELKRRLDNISITPEPVNTFNWKSAAAAFTVIGGLIGSVFYFNHQKFNVNPAVVAVSAKTQSQVQSDNYQALTLPSTQGKTSEESNSPDVEKSNSESTTATQSKDLSIAPVTRQQPAEFKSPMVKEDFGDTDVIVESNIVVPTGEILDNTESFKSKVEVVIEPKGKNEFQYQFYSNKLYLYCDFKNQPYELLELHNKKSKQMYLRYNGSYYELKPNQVEIADLMPIRNQELIKQLDSIKYK